MGNRYSIVARLHTVALTLLQDDMSSIARGGALPSSGAHAAAAASSLTLSGKSSLLLPSGHHRLLYRGTSTSFRLGASTDGEHLAGHSAVDRCFWHGILP